MQLEEGYLICVVGNALLAVDYTGGNTVVYTARSFDVAETVAVVAAGGFGYGAVAAVAGLGAYQPILGTFV